MAATAAVMMLAGCSGHASPGASESSSESEAATPSASASAAGRISAAPPERPAVMDNNTEEGAAAAVAYYIRQSLYAEATGDDSELQAMSGPGCKPCQYFVDRVHDENRGQWLEIPDVDVLDTHVFPSEQHDGAFHVELTVRRGEAEVIDPQGIRGPIGSQDAVIGFDAAQESGGWQMLDGAIQADENASPEATE